MDPNPQNGGRELNGISTPAVQLVRPIFFRLAKSEGQELIGELAEVKGVNWLHQPAKWFQQTRNSPFL